jgi:hypothetical protein
MPLQSLSNQQSGVRHGLPVASESCNSCADFWVFL